MKFLLDQDVYAATAQFLKEIGHDVLSASEAGHSQASDSDLLTAAQESQRILVTRDRDFGNLVFIKRLGSGVIYLRMSPSNLPAVHNQLRDVLTSYSETELKNAFLTIEAGRHRVRRLSR